MTNSGNNPRVGDIVRLDLAAPARPDVAIYYIERRPGEAKSALSAYHYDAGLKAEVDRLKLGAVSSQAAVDQLTAAEKKLRASIRVRSFQYDDAVLVWRSDATTPMAERRGVFSLDWDTAGLKVGDYVISWGDDRDTLFLAAAPDRKRSFQSLPTPPDKYDRLMAAYLPPMYRRRVKTSDIGPQFYKNLTGAMAEEFTNLENMANRLFDMLDAETADVGVLPLLANLFNVRLHGEPARWRRQIKRAVPLAKRKGTLVGLQEALDQAGIRLVKLTKLWQVVSEYVWTDGFVLAADLAAGQIGTLARRPAGDLAVSVRGDGPYMPVPAGYVRVVPPVDPTALPLLFWQGDQPLFKGDVVRVTYPVQPVPEARRAVEEYLADLPLADGRDETAQAYPPKNWNTRLVAEDDPLFHVLVPTRHPAADPVVFGKVRTAFLYSENTYNMDTYNGSLRDSTEPCDIDKDFRDHCSYCQSSMLDVAVEIDQLSDDRIREAKEIIKDNIPFHSVLHTLQLAGSVTDFLLPEETISGAIHVMPPKPQEQIEAAESITYQIKWADGSVENGTV